MNDKDNGGPAFPMLADIMDADGRPLRVSGVYDGMSLRDYFAAQIIGHLIASPLRQEASTEQDAKYAYVVADELLKARNA